MKNTIRTLGGAALLGVLPFTAQSTRAQTAVESTTTTTAGTATTATAATTSVGTISDFSPDVITIRSEGAPAPVAYRYTQSTTYVDEAGEPVSIETVKSGAPVTVYYAKSADGMIASKVVVRKTVTTPAVPVVQETRTTTTTTTEKDDD